MFKLLNRFNTGNYVIPGSLSTKDRLILSEAIEQGYVRDCTPYHLGTSASYHHVYILKPKGRLYLKRNIPRHYKS